MYYIGSKRSSPNKCKDMFKLQIMSKAHKWGKQPCCLKLKDKEKFEKKSHKLHDTIKTSGMQRERNRYETFM